MRDAWLSFLDYCFPIHEITNTVIYTDTNRYWLAKGLSDAGKANDWKIYISLLDEVNEDDITEIQQSFALLTESTLLVGIFSENNKSINLINQIFNPLYSPYGFLGFSLITLQRFPDQNFVDFLLHDFNQTFNLYEKYASFIRENNKISITSSQGTIIDCILKSELTIFPLKVDLDINNRHVIFPATEIIAELIPESVNGKIIIDLTIGEYFDDDELIDPFGLVGKPIKLLIEAGKITKVSENDQLSTRLNNQIKSLDNLDKSITKLGIGIGPIIRNSGFIQVDKLIGRTCNFGISDRKIEFVIAQPKIEPFSEKIF